MRPIAACMTLYHPDSEVVDNVRACLAQVERLYAVDNTEPRPGVAGAAAREVAGLAGVVYLPAGGNLGTAGAMNIAARRARADGYDLLLTLDQDSRVNPGMVARLLAVRGELAESGLPRVGIVSARQVTREDPSPSVKRPWQEEETIMTSGNLLELGAWEEAGPFDEGLFIDCVDHEFCLRLRLKGWAVVRVNDAFLTHELGNITAHRVFGKVKYTSNHSALRRYYIVRNRLWLMREYGKAFPDYARGSRKEIFKEVRNVLLLEGDKGAKLAMMARGVLDFWRGRMGRFGA